MFVELTGVTSNLLASQRATRLAEVVKGVRAVENRIEVEQPKVADAELVREVRGALHRDATTQGYVLSVEARDGVVVLQGRVPSMQDEVFAETVAKGVRGVEGVESLIDVMWTPSPRSDAEIWEEVAGRLRWDALVDDGRVDVNVDGGKVDLRGIVGSAAEKVEATRAAWVAGTTTVDATALKVDPWMPRKALRAGKYQDEQDGDIARAIRYVIQYEPRLSAFDVRVAVSGRVATLTGVVASLAAKSAAEQLARHTVGVVDELRLAPTKAVSDADVARQVAATLRNHPYTADDRTVSSAHRGKVTLTGRVESNFVRAMADSLVASLIGVRAIENKLEVADSRLPFVFEPYVDVFFPFNASGYAVSVTPSKSDRDLAREIQTELVFSPFVDVDELRVAVQNGRASLTGTVATWRERAAATEAALRGGASAVDNQLIVTTW